MLRIGLSVLLGVSLLFNMVNVKWVLAAGSTAYFGNSSFTPLYLDQGFVGRAVDLDFPDLGIRIKFAAGDIPAAGVMNILTEEKPLYADDLNEKIFDREYLLVWSTNAPQAPQEALVILDDSGCGVGARHCMIREDYFGQIRYLEPEVLTAGHAEARVKLGSRIRLADKPGYMTQGDASWYAYKNCDCAASPDFPKGSYVKVSLLDDSKSVVVKINDFGPERDIFPKRVIDLDKVAFTKLASTRAGVIQVKVEPVTGGELRNYGITNYEKQVVAETVISGGIPASTDGGNDSGVVTGGNDGVVGGNESVSEWKF